MTVTNYIWDEVNDTVLMETDDSGRGLKGSGVFVLDKIVGRW